MTTVAAVNSNSTAFAVLQYLTQAQSYLETHGCMQAWTCITWPPRHALMQVRDTGLVYQQKCCQQIHTCLP